MPTQLDKQKDSWILSPVLGAILFLVLYLVATFLYPGGSQANINSIGFSWKHNYWCNLLNEIAINGQPNPARPVAMTAMIILCATLTLFWYFLPRYFTIAKFGKLVIQISSVLTAVVGMLFFTRIDHDVVTNLVSFFGLIATVATIIALYKSKWYGLFSFGLFNVLLVALNNFFYYGQDLIVYLPVIQKISFGSFLIWICSIQISLYKKGRDTA
ncbi:MAG: hypothetical protein H7Y31_12020 [Chitinophagaceae bacterium]|nr:hypothetical protein [Chitinophagaceae bacterium]